MTKLGLQQLLPIALVMMAAATLMGAGRQDAQEVSFQWFKAHLLAKGVVEKVEVANKQMVKVGAAPWVHVMSRVSWQGACNGMVSTLVCRLLSSPARPGAGLCAAGASWPPHGGGWRGGRRRCRWGRRLGCDDGRGGGRRWQHGASWRQRATGRAAWRV